MSTYTAPMDLEGALTAPTTCPVCGAQPLQPVADGDRTNFLCRSCWRCWHQELSWTFQVDPRVCAACPEQEACLRHADRRR